MDGFTGCKGPILLGQIVFILVCFFFKKKCPNNNLNRFALSPLRVGEIMDPPLLKSNEDLLTFRWSTVPNYSRKKIEMLFPSGRRLISLNAANQSDNSLSNVSENPALS